MARRRGHSRTGREEREPDDSATYYVTSDSDRRYARQARQRTLRRAQRRWMIRLAILAVLGFAVWMWGGDVLRALRVQAHMTSQEIKQVGRHIKRGTEQRTGADLMAEESP